ncbi:glucosamine-6-phosphate deaminase [Christiangramia fulva]|uniref:Glucosamine-6-phosphate deaminase n=1 Tax=Christiangramia fulva TaxID=2126553 RepID=A0A2R3ZAF5_9FLAO|nr:glucosamine-6-phosphate deaminase [Christiangramia fulva]AVR47142.1 glucosamine-6-phosphate deaminase [Christiangramia fulva]
MKILEKEYQNILYKSPGKFEETRFEKIHNEIFLNSADASKLVAKEIAELIISKRQQGENCVLGLATGSSPINVYAELVRLHKEEGLDFDNVITFNLDEYWPMDRNNVHSYHYFMHEHLFKHINIRPENIHIPDGSIPQDKLMNYCLDYEENIKNAGGIDFQLLGIGRTGHIGFNEPGSHYNSGTRIITLDYLTRSDAASSFHGISNVPRKAITMGINTLKRAHRIVLLAWGQNKADIIKKSIEGEISSAIPATYLQNHQNTTFVLDKGAASELTRIKTPWLVGSCNWSEELKNKGIIWLSQKVRKAILNLTDKDYNDYGMSDLLAQEGSAYNLNIGMFNRMQQTITGWPGGKYNADDTNRPERALPKTKRILIFSPHPDDDVISMGGTFDRLVEQGHEVHVAYQTSGNIAVADHEALKFAEIAWEFASDMDKQKLAPLILELKQRKENEINSEQVRRLKTLIRKNESLGATRFEGLPDTNVHFLNLPFYETGTIKKNPLSQKDIDIVKELIDQIEPHQIYAAGDLADPHGTHKVCLDIILESLAELKDRDYMADCWLWLYRGAWHEFELHEIDMAVPLSPDQVLKKRQAIFFHQSQKDGVMFQGEDIREFWVRAEDRNKETAIKYRDLGLAKYAAMEAFKRMKL